MEDKHDEGIPATVLVVLTIICIMGLIALLIFFWKYILAIFFAPALYMAAKDMS